MNQSTVSTYTSYLSNVIGVAHKLDLVEMNLSHAMAQASMNFTGMAAASYAGIKLSAARVQCMAAHAQVSDVINGWLSRSAHSVPRLTDLRSQWQSATDRGRSIAEQMQDLIRRSEAEPEWSDDSKTAKQVVALGLHENQTLLAEAIGKMCPVIDGSRDLTNMIYASITTSLSRGFLRAGSVAARAPMPNPSGFGICTRTPQLAQILQVTARELTDERDNGVWKTAEAKLRDKMQALREEVAALWQDASVQPVMRGGGPLYNVAM